MTQLVRGLVVCGLHRHGPWMFLYMVNSYLLDPVGLEELQNFAHHGSLLPCDCPDCAARGGGSACRNRVYMNAVLQAS